MHGVQPWPELHPSLTGAAVALPQVKMMMESPVNPYVHMGNDLAGKDYADGVKYFTNIFPDEAKLHIMGAADDQVVGTLEVRGPLPSLASAGPLPACSSSDVLPIA